MNKQYIFVPFLLGIASLTMVIGFTKCTSDKVEDYKNRIEGLQSSPLTLLEKLEKAYQMDTVFAKYRALVKPEQINQLNRYREELHKNMNQWIADCFNDLKTDEGCKIIEEQSNLLLLYSSYLQGNSQFNNPATHQKIEALISTIDIQKKKWERLNLYLHDVDVSLIKRLDSIEVIRQTYPCCNCNVLLDIRDDIIVEDCRFDLSRSERMNCSEIASKQRVYRDVFLQYMHNEQKRQDLKQCVGNWEEVLNKHIQTAIEAHEKDAKDKMVNIAHLKIAQQYRLIPENQLGTAMVSTTTTAEELYRSSRSDHYHEEVKYKQYFKYIKPFGSRGYGIEVEATLTANYETCDVHTEINVTKVEEI